MDEELKEIRLYRLIQAFGHLCGAPLRTLDTVAAVDENYLTGAEACATAVAQRLLVDEDPEQRHRGVRMMEMLEPEWSKKHQSYLAGLALTRKKL